MLQVKTSVAASSIEGVGVFAAEPISKGAVIWRTSPQFDLLISPQTIQDAAPPLQSLLERYAYPSADQPGFLVFEADNGRFMNHADAPNSDYSEYGIGTALADIAVGEEITCDYRQFYPSAP